MKMNRKTKLWKKPHSLHLNISTILLYNVPNDPLQFWEKWKSCFPESTMHELHEQVLSEQSVQIVQQKIQQGLQFESLDIRVSYGFLWSDSSIIATPEFNRILMGETDFNT